MFAFTFFWAYTAFSQFMLQWYGNMPEETVWYKYRLFGEWQWVSDRDARRLLGVPVRVPDVALDQAHRAVARVLRGVAARVPLARPVLERDADRTTGRSRIHGNTRVDRGPADRQHRVSTTSGSRRVDITVWLGLFGVSLFGIGRNLNGNLIPIKDPTLGLSLAHENL